VTDSKRQRSVDITEEMIQKGIKALQDSGRLSFEADGLDREVVLDVLRAMGFRPLEKSR
jgi:hypothetical protein